MFLAGGAEKSIDTEDVAMKAFGIASAKFSWKKYPDQIDLEAVRVALRHASEPQHGSLVAGSMDTGWMLTPVGINWAQRASDMMGEQQTRGVRRGSLLASQKAERERLLTTSAWQKYSTSISDEISIHDFHAFVRVNEYSSRKKYAERINILRIACEEDAELSDLINFLDRQFGANYRRGDP